MKWKAKYTRPEVSDGTTRLKRVFAWRPNYVNGDIVWLQSFDVLQVYVVATYNMKIDGEMKSAKIGSWIEVSKRLI